MFLGVKSLGLQTVFVGLILVSISKLWISLKKGTYHNMDLFGPISLIVLASLSILVKKAQIFLYYPLIINLIFFYTFFSSLFRPQSFVESIARISEPNLPDQAIKYTRWVTVVWSIFFLTNAGVVLYIANWGTLEFWALYTGFVSYIIVGCIFTIEFVVRIFLKKKWAVENA